MFLLCFLILCRLYVNWRFLHGIEAQFLALQKGFNEVIPQHLLKAFDEKELEVQKRLFQNQRGPFIITAIISTLSDRLIFVFGVVCLKYLFIKFSKIHQFLQFSNNFFTSLCCVFWNVMQVNVALPSSPAADRVWPGEDRHLRLEVQHPS